MYMADIPYYKVIGPKEFKDDIPSKVWMNIGPWAQDTIVAYHAKQDPDLPGKLFKIIYKPPGAPADVARLRMPEDWVVEIPNFMHIKYEQEEQWTLQKSNDGKIMVVRR